MSADWQPCVVAKDDFLSVVAFDFGSGDYERSVYSQKMFVGQEGHYVFKKNPDFCARQN